MIRVWVTREESPDGPLSAALRECGLEVVHEPVVTRQVLAEALPRLAEIRADDWVVLTSPFSVEAVGRELAAASPSAAVVGESSRMAAEAHGLRVMLVAAEGSADSLFRDLAGRVTRGRVWYLHSRQAPPREPWGDVELIAVPLYDTRPRAIDRRMFDLADVIAVTSPSAVRAIGPTHLPFASLGPTTSAAVRQQGNLPWVEAPRPDFAALARSIAEAAYGSRYQRA